jgi:hypothetical protein
MALETWKEIFDFYRGLIRELNTAGVKSAATGGIACIFQGLVQRTKDLDLVVAPGCSETIRKVLSAHSFQGNSVAYMGGFGCPLYVLAGTIPKATLALTFSAVPRASIPGNKATTSDVWT